jgi:hypothetical protein
MDELTMLSSYPNVFNTCLVLLHRQNFSLRYEKGRDVWLAEKNGFKFQADNPIELLGLATIYGEINPSADLEGWWNIDQPMLIDQLDPEA